jgi:hypothetical protein
MFIKLPFLTLYYIGQAKGRSPDKERGSLPSCVVASIVPPHALRYYGQRYGEV